MWVSELGGFDRGFELFENLNKGIYHPHVRKLADDRVLVFRGQTLLVPH